jgi:hypothetical protein
MRTTIGQLVAALYDQYERRFHDEELAALATQVALNELLASLEQAAPPARPQRAHVDQRGMRTAHRSRGPSAAAMISSR